jgi:hypothetical protein
MRRILLILFYIVTNCLSAQTDQKDTVEGDTSRKNSSMVRIGYEVDGNDTVSVYLMKRFNYQSESITKEEREELRRLVRDIKKVLPYAKLAAFRLQLMEDNLNLLETERQKKKYIKACEKSIKKQFMDDLRNLTVTQGKILLKLIHRETGKSTWDIMSNYRGGFETLFWQAMAKTYHADMKDTYDPVVDYRIEEIIKSLEIENAP